MSQHEFDHLPDDHVVRGTSKISRLVGKCRWTVLAWTRKVNARGRCTHPIGKLMYRDDADERLCLRMGDWRAYIKKQKRKSA